MKRRETHCGSPGGFTLVEVLVVVGLLVILITVIVTVASGVYNSSRAAATTQIITTLSEATEAFRQSTGHFPLAVPRDAWGDWTDFATAMQWDGSETNPDWQDYFDGTATRPNFTWTTTTTYPTNIHMLTFQLQQVPESNTMLEQLTQRHAIDTQLSNASTPANELWRKEPGPCQLDHPLGSARQVYQPQDVWGIPLRYWSGNIGQWARSKLWNDDINNLLATKLQQANWGFFIESAGRDSYFGWYSASDSLFDSQQTQDNIYSVTNN